MSVTTTSKRCRLTAVSASSADSQMLGFFEGKVARWWTPDHVAFVDAIPLGATGKMKKNKLREQFKDFKLA